VSFWWGDQEFDHVVTEREDRPRFTMDDTIPWQRICHPLNRSASSRRARSSVPKNYKKRSPSDLLIHDYQTGERWLATMTEAFAELGTFKNRFIGTGRLFAGRYFIHKAVEADRALVTRQALP
jgi:hypothetical protein